jgi:tRNA nucleotidyltransferase (CCA-adding enzyme)
MNMVKKDQGWSLPSDIRDEVLSRVKPSEDDLLSINKAVDRLLNKINSYIEMEKGPQIQPLLAGSVAKGTIAGEPDIDIFLLFPKGTNRDDLEDWGLKVGENVLKDPKKKYTQHPYLTGSFEGYQTDIVPCQKIDRGDKLTTAVDRTPHHTEYITTRMSSSQKEDAVLLKSFFKGIGVYGAEDTVSGFSGYLCEVLILLSGDLNGVINWFSEMKVDRSPPETLERIGSDDHVTEQVGPVSFRTEPLLCETPRDLETYKAMFVMDKMVVIDPVDPNRNVASPVSDQTLAHTIHQCRELMKRPSLSFFHPWCKRPHFHEGNSGSNTDGHLYYLELPEGNPDIIVTQARSFLGKVVKTMERMGDWKVLFDLMVIIPEGEDIDPSFTKTRYLHSFKDLESKMIVFSLRCDPHLLPEEKVHWGPPADNRRAEDFMMKWGNKVKVDRESNRLFVKVKVLERDPQRIFLQTWSEIKLGSLFKDTFPAPVENQLIHEVIRDSST